MNNANSENEESAGKKRAENEEVGGRSGETAPVAAKDPTTTVPHDDPTDTTVRRDET